MIICPIHHWSNTKNQVTGISTDKELLSFFPTVILEIPTWTKEKDAVEQVVYVDHASENKCIVSVI